MKLLTGLFALSRYAAEHLTPVETKIARNVETSTTESNALLEKIVNINSGTFNVAGVRSVGEVLRPEFEKLGFQVRWIPMDEVHQRRLDDHALFPESNAGRRNVGRYQHHCVSDRR